MNRFWVAVVLGLLAVFPSWAQEGGPLVREIEIRFVGPETVNRAIVRANIQTAIDKPRSRDVIEQDVRNLIATGFFYDVRVLEEPVANGLKIIYQVSGKATLKEVVIQGGKAIRNERLKRETTFKPGDILDERKAHAEALKMEELYEKSGFPDAKIEPVTTIDKDTGKAILRFKITEGDRVFLKNIKITGNQAVPTGTLLKLMKTKRRWWGSWLAGSGVLKEEQFQDDLDRLREHYRSKGFIDMEVRSTKLERTSPSRLVAHIEIFEGTQYKVGDVQLAGNKLFSTAELMKRMRMTPGDTFTPEGLSKDIKALEDYYGSRGYLDTRVNAIRDANVETGRLDIRYNIREGELAYIDKIEIRGNTKTKDKVIRRELAVAPGDIYNTVRVNASQERLRNLNYFSKVEATPEPTPVPNRRDLVLHVEEQRTGNVTFGAGFSSIDNLIGFVEITQGNFDLFNWPNFTGGGQKLRLRAQVGLERQDYTLSFVEPWFLDQRLSLGVDLFRRSSGYLSEDFEETRTGGALRLEKALSEFLRVGIQYELQNIDLRVDGSASQELQSQEGEYLRSAVELNLVHDSRDSVFLTLRGNRTEVSAELAGGPLGGDVSIYKLNAKTTFYFPFFDKHVLQLLGAAGVVDAFGSTRGSGGVVDEDPTPFLNLRRVNDVPIFDRYFLGGANSLRGFSYRKVGPRDVNNEPVGGNTYVNATAEYSFPIVERVRGAAFFDIGQVDRDAYSLSLSDLKSNVGLGLRLNLPVGPIRLDYGYPIQSDNQTGKSGKFQFSVGYQF